MTSAIRMDYAANPSGDEAGHFAEHVVDQARIRGGPYRPSDRHAAEAVDRGGEAGLPVAEGELGDARCSFVEGPVGGEIPVQQVGHRRRQFAQVRGMLRSLFPVWRKALLPHEPPDGFSGQAAEFGQKALPEPPVPANPSVFQEFVAQPVLVRIRFRLLSVEIGAFSQAQGRKRPPQRVFAFERISHRCLFPCLQRLLADARVFFRTSIVSIRMSICICISSSLFESSALDSLPAFLRFVFFSSHEAAYTVASVLSELFV